MTKPLPDIPVRTAEELTVRWQTLLDPPVFGARSLWLAWLDDGLMLPVVVPIDDIPDVPDREMLTNLAGFCRSVADSHVSGEGHLATALCRPGPATVTRDDDAWADGLRDVLDRTDLTWSLHLAAGGAVRPMVDLPA